MALVRHWVPGSVLGLPSTFQRLSADITIDRRNDYPVLVVASAGANLWGFTPVGNMASCSGVYRVELTGYPSSSNAIISPLDSNGDQSWRLHLTSTGTIQLRNAANTAFGTQTSVIPTGTVVDIKWRASATELSVQVWDVEAGTQIGSTVTYTSTFGSVDNFRGGQAVSSPLIPTYYVYGITLYDTYEFQDGFEPSTLDPDAPKIALIGDSLLNMAPDGTSPQGIGNTLLGPMLAARGYPVSNIFFWGVGGKRFTVADMTTRTFDQNWADVQGFFDGDPDVVAILSGTNDRPQNDTTINGYLDSVLGTIGNGPRVVSMSLTSATGATSDDTRVSGLIEAKLAARENSDFYDWDAFVPHVADDPDFWLYPADNTHMTELGYSDPDLGRAAYIAAMFPDLNEPEPEPEEGPTYSNDMEFFRANSGLPAQYYSNNDHKAAWYRLEGYTGSLADMEYAYLSELNPGAGARSLHDLRMEAYGRVD